MAERDGEVAERDGLRLDWAREVESGDQMRKMINALSSELHEVKAERDGISAERAREAGRVELLLGEQLQQQQIEVLTKGQTRSDQSDSVEVPLNLTPCQIKPQ